jgi:hypothetical protein
MQAMTLTKYGPVFSLERAPHNNKTVKLSNSNKYLGARHQDWLAVSRNVTLTLTLTLTWSRQLVVGSFQVNTRRSE